MITCSDCGKSISRLAKRCKKCAQTGENNNHYIDGRSGTPYFYKQEQVKRHPEQMKARRAVRYAVLAGKLTRQPCEVCGDPKSEAHHEDYSKVLEVRWLCQVHHREVHGGMGFNKGSKHAVQTISASTN